MVREVCERRASSSWESPEARRDDRISLEVATRLVYPIGYVLGFPFAARVALLVAAEHGAANSMPASSASGMCRTACPVRQLQSEKSAVAAAEVPSELKWADHNGRPLILNSSMSGRRTLLVGRFRVFRLARAALAQRTDASDSQNVSASVK